MREKAVQRENRERSKGRRRGREREVKWKYQPFVESTVATECTNLYFVTVSFDIAHYKLIISR